MEFLKPPTDSLYKFVFVGGLLLIGLGIFLNLREQEKLDKALAAKNRAVVDSNLAMQHALINRVLPEMIEQDLLKKAVPVDIDPLVEDSQKQLKLELAENAARQVMLFRLLVDYPPTALRKKLHEKDLAEYNRKRLGFDSPDDYIKYIDKLTDAELVTNTCDTRAATKEATTALGNLEVAELDYSAAATAYQTMSDDSDELVNWGKWIAIIGGIAWFIMSQVHQDITLIRQAWGKRHEPQPEHHRVGEAARPMWRKRFGRRQSESEHKSSA